MEITNLACCATTNLAAQLNISMLTANVNVRLAGYIMSLNIHSIIDCSYRTCDK